MAGVAGAVDAIPPPPYSLGPTRTTTGQVMFLSMLRAGRCLVPPERASVIT